MCRADCLQFGSTNLVLELGINYPMLIGWQLSTAEFMGGLIMLTLSNTASGMSHGHPPTTGPRAAR
jgi:hypothetical protein